MNKVNAIHHMKALAIAHHIVNAKRVGAGSKEFTLGELIQIEVALKMAVDDLTTEAVKN